MQIYNTLSKKKEEFIPVNKAEVKIYACGPTVYNYIHLGNARPLCVCDVLRRFLKYEGYNVTFVQNFTDIDDKIINKAQQEGLSYQQVSVKYISEFKKDAAGLNILPPDITPLATQNIAEMVDIISVLLKKGMAYQTPSGDVCFRTKKFKGYGKLSGQDLDSLDSGARINVSDEKEDSLDFVLWKASKAGEPSFYSPFKEGRPGWHIECSAMANKFLGETVDIHFGGEDLIFPHHENEIAQSESYTGKPFANYWMHNGYININQQKMSKSLNNFFTVREVAKEFSYQVIRFLMLSCHYRSPINYSQEVMKQCQNALQRLTNCRQNLQFLQGKPPQVEEELNGKEVEYTHKIEEAKLDFLKSLQNDLNTADAIAALFDIVRLINEFVAKQNVTTTFINLCANIFDELTNLLGFNFADGVEAQTEDALKNEVEGLIKQREEARKSKDFKKADEIRDILKSRNIVLEDTKDGVRWKLL